MKKNRILGFDSDMEDLIITIKNKPRVANSQKYESILKLFSLDNLKVETDEVREYIDPDNDEVEFIKLMNKQLDGSSFEIKRKRSETELKYFPKCTAYILLQVLPGTNQQVVRALNSYAKKIAKTGIEIKEIGITMGSEDIVIKVETKKPGNELDAWVVNDFQEVLRKQCRDDEGGEYFVKSAKTLRVMRDIN